MEKPARNVMKRLKRQDKTVTRLRDKTSFRSNIFSKKYPGRKLVKSREDKYLNQFSGGIEANSNIDPS
jgi:hypothetical protein